MISPMRYRCLIHVLVLLALSLSLSPLILRRRGGGEKRQEIINSPSSWLTPPSHPEFKGQGRAERERVDQRVSGGPGPAPRGHLQLSLLHSHTFSLFLHTLTNIPYKTGVNVLKMVKKIFLIPPQFKVHLVLTELQK